MIKAYSQVVTICLRRAKYTLKKTVGLYAYIHYKLFCILTVIFQPCLNIELQFWPQVKLPWWPINCKMEWRFSWQGSWIPQAMIFNTGFLYYLKCQWFGFSHINFEWIINFINFEWIINWNELEWLLCLGKIILMFTKLFFTKFHAFRWHNILISVIKWT